MAHWLDWDFRRILLFCFLKGFRRYFLYFFTFLIKKGFIDPSCLQNILLLKNVCSKGKKLIIQFFYSIHHLFWILVQIFLDFFLYDFLKRRIWPPYEVMLRFFSLLFQLEILVPLRSNVSLMYGSTWNSFIRQLFTDKQRIQSDDYNPVRWDHRHISLPLSIQAKVMVSNLLHCTRMSLIYEFYKVLTVFREI